jgi:hypothetical protein
MPELETAYEDSPPQQTPPSVETRPHDTASLLDLEALTRAANARAAELAERRPLASIPPVRNGDGVGQTTAVDAVQPSVEQVNTASAVKNSPLVSGKDSSPRAASKGLTQASRPLDNPIKGRLRGGCNENADGENADYESTPPQWREDVTYKSYIRNLPECLATIFSKFLTEKADPRMLKSFSTWQSSATSLVVWKAGSVWDATSRDRFQMFIREADGAIPELLLARLLQQTAHVRILNKHVAAQ